MRKRNRLPPTAGRTWAQAGGVVVDGEAWGLWMKRGRLGRGALMMAGTNEWSKGGLDGEAWGLGRGCTFVCVVN